MFQTMCCGQQYHCTNKCVLIIAQSLHRSTKTFYVPLCIHFIGTTTNLEKYRHCTGFQTQRSQKHIFSSCGREISSVPLSTTSIKFSKEIYQLRASQSKSLFSFELLIDRIERSNAIMHNWRQKFVRHCQAQIFNWN